MDELTQEFLVESQEGLDRMERCLTELETKPGDAELLAEIFRAVHTIKGTTGFLALPRTEKLAHAGEHLLGHLRDGKLQATSLVVDVLLELLDGLRRVLHLIETTGEEGNRIGDNDAELIAVLNEVLAGGTGENAREVMRDCSDDDRREGKSATQFSGVAARDTLRVDVATLDRMMNQVGELVLARNQIAQSSGEGEAFRKLARRLDVVTAELQETVVRARTQPVGQLFQKFPRMVRDLARQCGKKVRLEFAGQETRLDKSLLEALKDPIAHAIRNAIDHGIESPEKRLQSGKEAEGMIRLSAHYEGGQVVVEFVDDGSGIDVASVKQRAVAHGLISEERADSMSEQEGLQLIFLAGFSTRDEVTTLSGRGVGMDVVRTNVESVGGAVEIESTMGEGVMLRMRVPLTLAIIPALIVRCDGGSFAIPRNTVNELLRFSRADEAGLVEMIGDKKWLRWRGELVPLVVLGDLLDASKKGGGQYVVVVKAKGRRFGLVIDDLLDPQEIVVKPLSRLLRQIEIFSGASILGSGEVALILDVAGVADRARVEAGDFFELDELYGASVAAFAEAA